MNPIVGDYGDVPDFIYGITREIWEGRGIGGKLDRYYGATCLVRAANALGPRISSLVTTFARYR